jgi:hypothetical protein
MGEIYISPDRSSVEAVPFRSSAMHLNAVGFLETWPCSTCLKITNLVIHDPNLITVDLTIAHPFPGNPKLTGFDVRAVLVTEADYVFPASNRWIARGDDIPRLLLPNGYTTLFNPVEYDPIFPWPDLLKYIPGKFATGGKLEATLNPYIAFRREQPRRMFEAGVSETRTVWIQVPSGPLHFGYVVDACWTHVDQVIDPLQDFPPEANCLEAYDVGVQIGSGLEPVQGSAQPIEIVVFDHQGLATISAVIMEAPDLFDGVVQVEYSEDVGADNFLFSGTLTNEKGAPAGEYPLLIRVIDTEEDPNLGQVDAYFLYRVQVGSAKGWVRVWGGPASTYGRIDKGEDVTVDSDGNIYVTGVFFLTADLDPGDGVDEHTAVGESDVYLSKFTPEGDFCWVRTWGGDSYDYASQVIIDKLGFLLVSSSVSGEVDIDPGPGVDMNEGERILSRFDTDGNYIWGIGMDLGGHPVQLGLDLVGNIYICGEFSNSRDFDPGPGEDIHVPNGDRDAFLIKLGPWASYCWGKSWGGPKVSFFDDFDNVSSIAVSSNGNAYLIGWISNPADYDPGDGVSEHEGGRFFSIFDTYGNFLGVHVGELNPRYVFIDDYDNLYGIGELENGETYDLDPGPGIDEHSGPCCFLTKFGPDYSYKWGRSWGFGLVHPGDVAITHSGEVYLTGDFYWNLVDFDPGPPTDFHTSAGEGDAFLTKYLANGEYQWTRTWGSTHDDSESAVAADSDGNAYMTGPFTWETDFDPGPGTEYYTPMGCGDAYLLKIPPDGNW